MLSLILLLLLVIVVVLVILVLRKNQQKHTKDTVDRTAPLPSLGDNMLPDFVVPPVTTTAADVAPTGVPAASIVEPDTLVEDAASKNSDNWQHQVKTLRASQQYGEALQVCRTQYPKALAFQQAAIILRQQIKINQERNMPFEQLLRSLYTLAALADVYSSGNRHEGFSIVQIEAALQNIRDKYSELGYQQLKLLNKSDIRLLEQAWGKPDSHCHAEDL